MMMSFCCCPPPTHSLGRFQPVSHPSSQVPISLSRYRMKLVYFDMAGRAEMVRLALFIGGIPFEDVRLTRDEFAADKQAGKYPWGQVPVLELDDGKVVGQSTALLRYAGRLSGLYPDDPVQALLVDEALGALDDMLTPTAVSLREPDADRKAKLRSDLATVTYPRHLAILDKRLADNSSGLLVGEKLTIADLQAYTFLSWVTSGILDGIPTDLLTPYTHVTKLVEQVKGHPKVAEWEAAHPPKK